MTSWHSYPKVWNLGHAAVEEIFHDEVHLEEKIDGSQFSFGKFNGELKIRSKGAEMLIDAPEKMFQPAVDTVKELAPLLTEGHTYRAEFLGKPKHNILAYARVPAKFLILFDVNTGEEKYLNYDAKKAEAERLGLECVPCLYRGKIESLAHFQELLETDSCLGGQKLEGVVAKNYLKFGPDKKALLGKFVSEQFKEKHKVGWKEMNPMQGGIIEALQKKYKSEVRWEKAVQHLREAGQISDSPKDIASLIKEIKSDAKVECEAEIKEDLFKWAWPQIERRLTGGAPEWYKQKLLEKQFQ
jgi:hypothetical protein